MFILFFAKHKLPQSPPDYANVFPLDSAAVLPEHTGINDQFIDLVDNR